jgi:hypothetical protein
MFRRNQIVDRFVAMWNERDPDLRRKAIEEVYAPDAEYLMFAQDPLIGYDAIAAQIDYAHNLYYDQGYEFKPSNNAEGHHNLVRFTWVLTHQETGDLFRNGAELFVLAPDGRIQHDYQFLLKPAIATWDDY